MSRFQTWFESLWTREALKYGVLYLFLAFINLRLKIFLTPAYHNGILEHIHGLLLKGQYANNEQSRLFQYLIPEFFHSLFNLSIPQAYILQRWTFVFMVYLCFHMYLRKWFDSQQAFAGVTFLAAVMPLSYFNHLQESSPLLLVTFLLALWAIRERRTFWFVVVLLVGSVNNETMLILPAVYFLYHLKSWDIQHLIRVTGRTLGCALPAYLAVGTIRYFHRNLPHLGGYWHWPDNIRGMIEQLTFSPLDYWKAGYLYIIFLFGFLWIYALLDFVNKPLFLRRSTLIIPVYIGIHLLTGIIYEVRQMLPLSFIIIPLGLMYLFNPGRITKSLPDHQHLSNHRSGI